MIDAVSPQFPCGAAWLANALLELDVQLPDLWGFDTAAEWRHDADGSACYVAASEPWRQTLASLQPGRRFRFRRELQVRFSHAFPWQLEGAQPVILIVRDPRDALHSEWQRHRRNRGLDPAETLPGFASRPFEDGPIGNLDFLWLHLSCWLQLERPLLLLRFEDFKHDPPGALRRVCDWLRLDVTAAAIARAAAASDVSRLQRVETALQDADPAARQFNRRGQPYEWRQAWQPDWHRCLGPHWRGLLARLGYPSPLTDSGRPLDFVTAEALAWRGLASGSQADAWRRRVDRCRHAVDSRGRLAT
jgi:hypothetical protein